MSDQSKSGFAHIYYDDWQIGANYERMVKGKVIPLGRLIDKKYCGRVYDSDMVMTFERADGTQWEHMIEFDSSYRRKD